ncbi:AF4/FMR2 family member 1 isoform X2 [Monodelphis domestica]|uniref:AF4/FMR2 family member 1 isoform X2 n=1 Tax=Monodelphis domestica TaxID=13616 RepID=UPI00044359F0|nr:AF4/FMR2 family member 1 isoform X2 [Monodelphis domestica]
MESKDKDKSCSNSLFNEDRNLLRIREKERRNQEVHQEKKFFPVNTPLFGEPYKTSKGDELSSRIQNTLGNYEEVKELISTKNQNLFGIPEESSLSLTSQGKSRCSFYPEKTGSITHPPFFSSVHHQVTNSASGPSIYIPTHCPKATQARMEPAMSLHARSDSISSNQHQGKYYNGQDRHHRSQNKKDELLRPDGTSCVELSDSALEMDNSLLSSTLSSSVAPLASHHSNQPTGSRMLGSSKGSSKGCAQAKSPSHLALEPKEEETPQYSLAPVTGLGMVNSQPSSQSFPPPSLPSKTTAMQQKPTAYVRPMDGQDQAPSESPELKPLPDDYHGHSYEKIPDFKVTAKAKLSKLKMPPQSTEAFPNEVHCVEEILKEMTHSWPPPLTAIHTPNTAESSKFPFPTKEFQHLESVLQNHKQHGSSSKPCSNSQQGTSMLEDDLQISDSDDSGDEQVSEKPPPSSAPASVPQSLADSVVSAHSSNTESESTSDSDSSSDSESESSSSGSEENEPLEPVPAEPDPPIANKWQLDNWLTKVTQPTVSSESLSETGLQHHHQEAKGKGSSSTSGHEHSVSSSDPHPSNSSHPSRTASEATHPSKRNYPKSGIQQGIDGSPHWQTVGSKQPKKPMKASIQDNFQGDLRVESEPILPHGSKDQSSKDKPKVKTKGRPRSCGDRQEKCKSLSVPCEKKHKNSHSVPTKTLLDPESTKNNTDEQSLEHFPASSLIQNQGVPHSSSSSNNSRSGGYKSSLMVQEELVGNKVLLPSRETKSLRDTPLLQSLVVKIDLALLSQVPKPSGKGSQPKKMEHKLLMGNKQESESRNTEKANKSITKRKGDAERDLDSKKIKLEKDAKFWTSSSAHKDSNKTRLSKSSSDFLKKELPPPPPSASPSHKAAKNVHKRPRNESYSSVQGHSKSTSTTKDSHKDSSSSKHKKMEGKSSGNSTCNKASPGDLFPVPSLPNGNSKLMKHQVKFEKQAADFHMKEAKRLKQKAESMSDKVGKAFKYLDAVLSYIECGIALESETPTPKSVYSTFSETVDFIKFILTLKYFPDSPTQEKIFIVLCLRCQSILYMAMFRCKKDTAIKYSRTLNEHFKSSSRLIQAASSGGSRNTSTPSPLSPMTSASSGFVQPGSSASSTGNGGVSSTVSTPIVIQNMTSSYVTITSHILNAYDLWEQADMLARKNTEFFTELSTSVCTLALNSSLMELVLYTRQALQQLRQVAKML